MARTYEVAVLRILFPELVGQSQMRHLLEWSNGEPVAVGKGAKGTPGMSMSQIIRLEVAIALLHPERGREIDVLRLRRLTAEDRHRVGRAIALMP